MLLRAEAANGTARTTSNGQAAARYENWQLARADFDTMLANCKVMMMTVLYWQ
jgi:hypothetical protein